MKPKDVKVLFELRDLWVGVFWDHDQRGRMHVLRVFVCFVPCLPIRMTWRWTSR